MSPTPRERQRFMAKISPEPNTGCWLWMAHCDHDGYARIRVRKKSHPAHRLSWSMLVGPIPDGLLVLHSCEQRSCVNPAHLVIGDDSASMRRREAQGRANRTGMPPHPRGEKSSCVNLTEAEVREIRRLAPIVRSSRVLGARYGVTKGAIDFIVTRRNWAHVL